MLTEKQRELLYEEYIRRKADGESHAQKDLATWAASTFKLKKVLNQSTVSRILKAYESKKCPLRLGIHKKDRTGANHTLEKALYGWICDQLSRRVCLSGTIVRNKALSLQTQANEKLPVERKLNFKHGTGWLSRFQTRWNLKSWRAIAAAADAEILGAEAGLQELRQVTNSYLKEDIWNADEFGLFYNMPPDKTISTTDEAVSKREKNRIAGLACCNATGTRKFPIMFIGRANAPRCFNNKSGQELGFDYHSNPKARMTSALFFEWLQRFNEYIHVEVGRRCLLLIDDASPHGHKDNMPNLPYVQIAVLPPNTTSKIQPCDAGIIATLKVGFRRMQMERVLDLMEVDLQKLYKLDQLTAMKWVAQSWEEMKAQTIENCWRQTGILRTETRGLMSISNAVEDRTDTKFIEEAIRTAVPVRNRMNIQDFLQPAEEDDVNQDVSELQLVEEIVDTVTGAEPVLPVDEDEVDEVLPSLAQQLETITKARLILRATRPDYTEGFRALGRLQSSLKEEKRLENSPNRG